MCKDNRKFIKTKAEGVFYRLSAKAGSNGNQDRIYCFCYTDSEGKTRWKTVGRHSNGFRVKSAKIARAQFLAELAEKSVVAGTDNKCTVDTAIAAYLSWCDNQNRDMGSAPRAYNTHLKRLIGHKQIGDITKNTVISVVAHLKEAKRQIGIGERANKHLAGGTIVGVLSFVRAAITKAIENNLWTGKNPFDPSEKTWTYNSIRRTQRVRFLTQEEARLLLDELAKADQQVHDMVLLSLRTGLRPTEIFRLRGIDVDTNANVLHILAKGKKRMAVQIPKDMITMLASYNREPSEPIFQRPKLKTAFKTTPKPFRTAVRHLNLMPEDSDSLYRITFHTMRHTFASWLAQSGKVSLMELQKLMRHQKIEMTLRYAHLIPGQENSKLSIIDEILA